MEKHRLECRTIDLPEWNFELAKDCQKLMDLLNYERPEIVWFAPACTKQSPLQDFNVNTEAKTGHSGFLPSAILTKSPMFG